jgi:signal transduction histidine kinase
LDGRAWEELWDEPLAEGVSAALLVVTVPVATGETLGWARLWVEGRAVAAEFAALDRGLARQAGVVAGLGGLGLGGGLAWVWVTLARARERLRAQQADLTRANRALMFSAQASAVGALSAHLLHGIKNPLAGLEGFLAEGEGTGGGEAWREASATARRLRAMVGEVMAVMRECEDDLGARCTVAEVFDGVAQRAAGGASGGVRVAASAADAIELGGREAGLAGLVLDNLATNAREAAGPGGRVELRAVGGSAGGVNLLVVDDGPGLPEAVRRGLFRPLASTKPGGAGLGLALSAELARAAGGELRLVRSDESGTEWSLRVPAVVA